MLIRAKRWFIAGLCGLLISLMVAVVTAQAFVPLAVAAYVVGEELTPYLVTSLAIHLAGLGAYIAYQMTGQSSTSHQSDPTTGDVSRDATVTWVDVSSKVPMVETANISARIKKADLDAIAGAGDTGQTPKYPNLHVALTKNISNPLSGDSVVGGQYQTPDAGDKVVQSINWLAGTQGGDSGKTAVYVGMSGIYRQYNIYKQVGTYQWGGNTYSNYQVGQCFTDNNPHTPIQRPSTPQEFGQMITNTQGSSVAPVSNSYQGDIDKLIKDQPNIIHFEDGPASKMASNQPLTPPTPATPAQIATGLQYQAAQQAGAAASTLQQKATASAGIAAASAAAAAADPGNATKAQQAAVDAAQAAGDAAAASQAAGAAAAAGSAAVAAGADGGGGSGGGQQQTDSSSYSAPGSPNAYGDGSTFDFGKRTTDFFTAVKSSAIFGLPGQFLSNVPTSSTSTVSFNGGRYGNHSFDFNDYALVFTAIRGIVLVVFGWYSVRIVTLKGGGG